MRPQTCEWCGAQRLGPARRPATLSYNGLTLDLDAKEVWRAGECLDVQPKQFDVLTMLMVHRGQVVGMDKLATLWRDTYVQRQTIHVHVYRLRRALGDDADLIETVGKAGYRFDGPTAP